MAKTQELTCLSRSFSNRTTLQSVVICAVTLNRSVRLYSISSRTFAVLFTHWGGRGGRRGCAPTHRPVELSKWPLCLKSVLLTTFLCYTLEPVIVANKAKRHQLLCTADTMSSTK